MRSAGGTFDRTQGEVSCTFVTVDPVDNSENSGGHSQNRTSTDIDSSNGTLQNQRHRKVIEMRGAGEQRRERRPVPMSWRLLFDAWDLTSATRGIASPKRNKERPRLAGRSAASPRRCSVLPRRRLRDRVEFGEGRRGVGGVPACAATLLL
jgi:hypothetical protein